MSKSLAGNAVIGQSGGPTAVINQSLVGCIEGLRGCDAIGRIFGARHAVRVMVDNDFLDLTDTSQALLDRIANTPSSALGSSRDKPDEAYCRKIFERFEENDVRYFAKGLDETQAKLEWLNLDAEMSRGPLMGRPIWWPVIEAT